jgi:RNA polymerase sigma-70 factor (ECF subfamily)
MFFSIRCIVTFEPRPERKLINTETIALLKGIKGGDEKSFEMLFDLHWEELYRYCLGVIEDADDAEDIVQDIFCEIWENRAQLVVQISLKAYLFGALRKKILKRFRDNGIHQKHLEILNATLLQTRNESPLASLIASDLLQNLLVHLQTLPHKEREVYILNQIDGYSIKEISQRFSTSEQTVRNQLNNAARKLGPIVMKILS